jgi:hypothetical protein
MTAAGVNLTYDALANEISVAALFDNADKFMPDRSVKAGVAARDFQIGVANAGQENTNQGFLPVLRFLDLSNR